MYKEELAKYIEGRLATSHCSVELITGGNSSLMGYIHLMWTVQFYVNKCKELEDHICVLNDFSDGGT
jgi:hypothetical protein